MRSFSLKAFVVIALVHIVGTMLLLDAAVSRIKAFEHGETFLWLTILLWLWEPVPMLLSHYVHLNPLPFLLLPHASMVTVRRSRLRFSYCHVC